MAGEFAVLQPTVKTFLKQMVLLLFRYEFSSALQRMSVVVRDPLSQELYGFCKGSTEVVSDLCMASSLPYEFHSTIIQYTRRGARVVAIAGKALGRLSGKAVEALKRTEVESKLILLGCLIFSNKLKVDTKDAIVSLSSARCRSIIATGDGPLTAMAVAKGCGLIGNVEYVSLFSHNIKACACLHGVSEHFRSGGGVSIQLGYYHVYLRSREKKLTFQILFVCFSQRNWQGGDFRRFVHTPSGIGRHTRRTEKLFCMDEAGTKAKYRSFHD